MLLLIGQKSCIFRFLLLALLVASCSEKSGNVIAQIDFSQIVPSPLVAEISGVSAPEPWGRWSDASIAPTIKIRLTQPLPTQFLLTMTGQSMPGNETATVKIGKFEEQFYLQKLSDVAEIHVKLEQPEDTIEIIPSNPTSPKKLGISEDGRKLGVGLATILIEN